jgi:hypothetical protein
MYKKNRYDVLANSKSTTSSKSKTRSSSSSLSFIDRFNNAPTRSSSVTGN